MESIEEVWTGDLFDRRREADELIGYLESVAGRPSIREDGHAHVLAVDTAYGHGKTYFLKRLNRHLQATDHVSAYIDAWVDDLEDQPMVALAATLDRALEPWVRDSDAVADGLVRFKNSAGRVAKIVSIGLAKRAAGFLITQGAAEAVGDELTKASEITRDISKDALKEAGKTTVEDTVSALTPVAAPSMEARIERFREGQEAIQAMKDSLASVIQALQSAGMKLPITIIVDELDRCRPTYAIKVLEEIKHLFDVPGVAFLLGMHGRQLEHSVSAAYGQAFDGEAYLRRFFSRRYSLRPVSLKPLIEHLIDTLPINVAMLGNFPVLQPGGGRPVILTTAELITDYLSMYHLAARDAFSILEGLHTALALSGGKSLLLPYLLPLIIARHLGKDGLLEPISDPKWVFAYANDPFGREVNQIPASHFIRHIDIAAHLEDTVLSEKINSNDVYARMVVDVGFKNSSNAYHLLQNYGELVRAVARFS